MKEKEAVTEFEQLLQANLKPAEARRVILDRKKVRREPVAEEAGASSQMVSQTWAGVLGGDKADAIRQATARRVGIPVEKFFPEAA